MAQSSSGSQGYFDFFDTAHDSHDDSVPLNISQYFEANGNDSWILAILGRREMEIERKREKEMREELGAA